MAEITLEQLQNKINQLEIQLSELDLNNENDHGSIITQLEDLSSVTPKFSDLNVIDNKISNINNSISNINTKLLDIDTNALNITELRDELEFIKSDLQDNNLTDINSRLDELSSKISYTQSSYVTKTSFDDALVDINDRMGNYVTLEEFDEVSNRVNTLETDSDISVVTGEISDIISKLEQINISINNINSSLQSNKNDINSTSNQLTNITNEIQNDIAELNIKCQGYENKLKEGNDHDININKELADINCEVNKLRLKCANLTNRLEELLTFLSNKIDTTADNLMTNLENHSRKISNEYAIAIKDHNNYNQAHYNKFKSITDRLDKIDKKGGELDEIKDLAEKKWITVLSPDEYKRLPSSNIRQDQLYMCIKYGKPYALYIGKVLIAQRNTVKDSGFTYTFPVPF